ncbi:MAG: hypothetical protein RIQ46_953 [Pseudomonadota bacterium]|jgi:metal-responsive CopG/Arc/MetJ family transcriptional regulator
MRTLVDIPADDIDRLDALAGQARRSRAAAIRDAVRLYLAQHEDSADWIERGFGYWADRDGPVD